MKNDLDLSYHNLNVEDATELALDRPLWRLLAASTATHWSGAKPNNDDDDDDDDDDDYVTKHATYEISVPQCVMSTIWVTMPN